MTRSELAESLRKTGLKVFDDGTGSIVATTLTDEQLEQLSKEIKVANNPQIKYTWAKGINTETPEL